MEEENKITYKDVPGLTIVYMEQMLKASEKLFKKSYRLYRLSIAITSLGVVLMLLLKLL